MSVGVGIFLLVLGAILAFAVHADLGWLSLAAVGWILILAGAVELVLTLTVWSKRRHAGTVTRREVYHDGGQPTVVERRSEHELDVSPDTGPGGSVSAPPPGRYQA